MLCKGVKRHQPPPKMSGNLKQFGGNSRKMKNYVFKLKSDDYEWQLLQLLTPPGCVLHNFYGNLTIFDIVPVMKFVTKWVFKALFNLYFIHFRIRLPMINIMSMLTPRTCAMKSDLKIQSSSRYHTDNLFCKHLKYELPSVALLLKRFFR